MKIVKTILFFLILFVPQAVLHSASIGYVYGNSISSVDFEYSPRIGDIFSDEEKNVLAVRSSNAEAVVFDKLITRGDYNIGSSLKSRYPLNFIGFTASTGYVFLTYSLSTPIYPLYASATVGYSFDGEILALAGARLVIPLARLWDSGSTFIENGKLQGWGNFGLSISPEVDFSSSYGFSYRHNIDLFSWELGASWLYSASSGSSFFPYLGVGVDI